MTLFELANFGNRRALIDGESGKILTYENLNTASHQFAETFGSKKILCFLFIKSNLDFLISYVSLLNHGHATAVFDDSIHPELKSRLIELYRPHFLIESAMHANVQTYSNYFLLDSPLPSVALWKRYNIEEAPKLNPELQLLLSTSGTTGSPKLIRLSVDNITSNARSIIEYLAITPDEKAIATLPFHYSFGLSILHSHLLAGACVVLTSHSVVQEGFWNALNHHECTSLAGVPYTYQLLDRIQFEKMKCPSLHTLTQAGGRLSLNLIAKFDATMKKRNGVFFTMYGQTEATARIAYLPPSLLSQKAGAIGISIPGGKIQLYDGTREILENDREGELVYTGRNVMLGYSEEPADLALGDVQHSILYTGDLGYRDADGIYYLTGRCKRISKIFGLRINLEEIEQAASSFGDIAATSDDTTIRLYYEFEPKPDMEKCVAFLTNRFHLAPTAFDCIGIMRWPLTASGKIDYTRLVTL